MVTRYSLILTLCVGFLSGTGSRAVPQDTVPEIRVTVNMVQLNVAVTDDKGNYIDGLRPEDFSVTEDGIQQTVATFAKGNEPARRVADLSSGGQPGGIAATSGDQGPNTIGAGANVFVLFDTSNYMYRGFVFAQDAIADFIRSLQGADKIAFYSYSRDLSRIAPLTSDRAEILRSVRKTVAGDDAALYNSLLMTIEDAARYTGRKIVVVFSNGPDNASMVPPEDVAEFAQSSGAAIYMVSTRQAQLEPVSTAVFERMTAATGGKAYFSKNWRDERRAFASIRADLSHLYSLSYYPQPNPNKGWRSIKVKLVGSRLKKYRVRTRDGYRPQPNRAASRAVASGEESMPE